MNGEKKQDINGMDVQELMKKYNELGKPGPHHEFLAGMAGRWKTRTRSWMGPDGPPMESTGVSEQKMILDGRFLRQDFTGEMMGDKFIGIGVTGYDNHTRKYVSTWMDSMSTAIMYFEGEADAGGKTITQTSDYDDPFRGPMKWRSVTRIEDYNTHLFEMFVTGKNGKEERMMEITYTRY
jgi:hypothetical protein